MHPDTQVAEMEARKMRRSMRCIRSAVWIMVCCQILAACSSGAKTEITAEDLSDTYDAIIALMIHEQSDDHDRARLQLALDEAERRNLLTLEEFLQAKEGGIRIGASVHALLAGMGMPSFISFETLRNGQTLTIFYYYGMSFIQLRRDVAFLIGNRVEGKARMITTTDFVNRWSETGRVPRYYWKPDTSLGDLMSWPDGVMWCRADDDATCLAHLVTKFE